MGPAVLNGGVSTLIAFILLVSSDSHVFSSFFKIFLLVVLFGVSLSLQLQVIKVTFSGVARPRSPSGSPLTGLNNIFGNWLLGRDDFRLLVP